MKMMFVGNLHRLHYHIVENIQSHVQFACILLGNRCHDEPVDQLFD